MTGTGPKEKEPDPRGIGLSSDGAGDGIRTRDTELGKLVLYQLSYSRNSYDFSFA